MSAAFDLDRFVRAQDPVYDQVLRELDEGAKRTHWMWFVFPQLRGHGRSATAQRFGLADAREARAYLAHPCLGARLAACTRLACAAQGRTAAQIFGAPDDLKFRSCMTLFATLPHAPDGFSRALDRFFGGAPDAHTLRLLAGEAASDGGGAAGRTG